MCRSTSHTTWPKLLQFQSLYLYVWSLQHINILYRSATSLCVYQAFIIGRGNKQRQWKDHILISSQWRFMHFKVDFFESKGSISLMKQNEFSLQYVLSALDWTATLFLIRNLMPSTFTLEVKNTAMIEQHQGHPVEGHWRDTDTPQTFYTNVISAAPLTQGDHAHNSQISWDDAAHV